MKDAHVVGAALRTIRVDRQMRQKDLAERAAVSTAHLCRIENDADYCSDMAAVRFARILGCKLDDFTAPGPHPKLPTWRRTAEAA